MTDEDVKNLFSTVGVVQSCKVIREKQTMVSLGYAFINYCNPVDAERAILKMNGLPLQQKTIKVSYARPSCSTIKNANLYVANLPKSFTQSQLEEMFRLYGNIITSKVLMEEGSEDTCRGVAFVRYDKHSEAESAITAINGKVIPGATQPLLVKYANPPKTNTPAAQNSSATTMNTIYNLAALARKVNPLMQAGASTATGGGGPIRSTSMLPSMRFNPVSVNSSVPHSLTPITACATCLFVYNIPEDSDDRILYRLFGPFGAITSVKVIKDQSGKCKRFGFVNMVNFEEAVNAISALNGLEYEGKQLQVSIKKPNGN